VLRGLTRQSCSARDLRIVHDGHCEDRELAPWF
jgi:hypothetical protein